MDQGFLLYFLEKSKLIILGSIFEVRNMFGGKRGCRKNLHEPKLKPSNQVRHVYFPDTYVTLEGFSLKFEYKKDIN